MYPHKATVKFWRKSTRKSGRMHIWQLKIQEFQDPKAGPGPQPILAHLACLTSLCCISKILDKISGPPLTKSWLCCAEVGQFSKISQWCHSRWFMVGMGPFWASSVSLILSEVIDLWWNTSPTSQNKGKPQKVQHKLWVLYKIPFISWGKTWTITCLRQRIKILSI